MKIFKLALIVISLFSLTSCIKFSTSAKSQKIQLAEDVLQSLQQFNNRYSNFKGISFYNFLDDQVVSEDQLERESKTLDIKFDDLLKVFTEPNFLAKGKNIFYKF